MGAGPIYGYIPAIRSPIFLVQASLFHPPEQFSPIFAVVQCEGLHWPFLFQPLTPFL